jgi:hypothetical protein
MKGGVILNIRKGKKKFKGQSGFVSIEAVFAMSVFLIVFMLVIGFFTFIHPYTTIQRDVQALTTLAERQGGLTNQDVQNFKDKLTSYSFVSESVRVIDVEAVTSESSTSAIGVDGLDVAGTNYISRDSKEFINITVTVPSNTKTLIPVLRYFNVSGITDKYTFQTSVMSERY